MKLFIQRALVKIQSLNIKICSDRKSSYFYTNVYNKKSPLHLKNCVIYKNVLIDNFLYNLLFI